MNAPALPFGVPIVPPLPVAALCATLDFETYSEAGYIWNEAKRTWDGPVGSREKGLFAVGSRKYAEHPTAEILTASYRLPNGAKKRWKPGQPLPMDLFHHIAMGGLVEAHNAMFERNIWTFVGEKKYGFPPIPPRQWRCSMAKGRASGYPGELADLGAAMRLNVQKDKRGGELINLFCKPRKPTKLDPSKRVLPQDDPDAFEGLQSYCDTDRDTEHEASGRLPELIPFEQEYWFADQAVNFRGLGVDLHHVEACAHIVGQVVDVLSAEAVRLCGLRPSQVQKVTAWMAENGCKLAKFDDEHVTEALKRTDLKPVVRRVLEIRQLTGSASVKKVFAMRSFCSDGARLHDLFIYHGARTGRDTHADVQPGNLPKAGPKVWHCLAPLCNRWYGAHAAICPWCSSDQREGEGAGNRPGKGKRDKPESWGFYAVGDALEAINSRSAAMVQWAFGDALLTVSGVVRSLICAAEGHDLICSDYSSIEAVVIAALAGEQWRLDAFHERQDIYYHGAGSVTGQTYEWYKAWEKENGQKHPDRQKLGKPAELALGYAGWIGAWYAFGGEGTESEVREIINRWRAKSPAVVELWGGQVRGEPWSPKYREYYGLEGMAVQAVLNPGQRFTFRLISFEMDKANDVLHMYLPSGRSIKYREPRLAYHAPIDHRTGQYRDGWAEIYHLSYMTYNTNPKMGPLGWVRMPTYGGKLAENATQAVARDIMANAVVKLEAAYYPVVLRIHDELASEVPHGFGSVEEYERIMCDVPPWARGWPIRADGGWRGARYRKG